MIPSPHGPDNIEIINLWNNQRPSWDQRKGFRLTYLTAGIAINWGNLDRLIRSTAKREA